MMPRSRNVLPTLAALALALPTGSEAWAADTWSDPHPGVRMLSRTISGPNRIHALVVDLCYPGVRVRATESGERQRTVSSFGNLVGAAFHQRRKTLRNNLKGLLDADQITALGIDPAIRSESLSLQQFILLQRAVTQGRN